jgi:hypothetical protein
MAEVFGDNIAVVFNGFLSLTMKEKVRLVDVLNEFFDYPDRREQMRAANEELVANLISENRDTVCKCCRK